jgi:hypothetical protein
MPSQSSDPNSLSALERFDDWLEEQRDKGPRGLALPSSPSGDKSQLSQLTEAAFVPHDKVEEYIQRNAPELLAELFEDPEKYLNKDKIIRTCALGFAILLSIGKGQLIKEFVKQEKLYDRHLPFTSKPAEFPSSSGSAVNMWHEFDKAQWGFVPHIFQYEDGVELILDPRRIVPITHRYLIDTRTSSNIWKIAIHGQYNRLHPQGQTSVGFQTSNHLVLT